MESLEAKGRRRVQLERPLNSSYVGAVRRRNLARVTTASLLAVGLLASCSSGSNQKSSTAPRRTSPPTTPVRLSTGPYTWQRAQSAADLGGGSTSTLSAVLPPATSANAAGRWLIAGTQFKPAQAAEATVWTSSNASSWAATVLPAPSGAEGTAADGATNWGSREVVVGSASTATGTRAAVWVSQHPGQDFVPAPANASLEAPPTAPATYPSGAVMDTVTSGALGLFAAGTVNGKATIWYSTNGLGWRVLNQAGTVINQQPGAVVNDILSTASGVFAGGSYTVANKLAAALWYSSDGIHWAAVDNTAAASPGSSGPGDQVITSLVDLGQTASSLPGAPAPSGLLAVGGVMTGSSWQPASWISPNGFSWSQTSESFPLDGEPPDSPGALAYQAAGPPGTWSR